MMNIKFFVRMIITLFASAIFASSAYAQSSVLVIDQARVMRDSEVGKYVARQIEGIANSIEGEFKAKGAALSKDEKKWTAEKDALGEGGIKSRPDLQKRYVDLKKKRAVAERESVDSLKGLKLTTDKAVFQVQKKIDEIAKTIGKERNAGIVIDKKFLFYSSGSVDITDTVISRLNSQMKTIPVKRITK